MEIGKTGLLLIAVCVVALLVTIIALAVPSIGAFLHDFAVQTVGPALWGSITWLFTAPYSWGAQSFINGAALTVGIIVIFALIWTFALKTSYNKLKGKLGIGTAPAQPDPSHPTMTTPQTVIVKEVPVSTAEKKDENA